MFTNNVTIKVGQTGLLDADNKYFCIKSIKELVFAPDGTLISSCLCVGVNNEPCEMSVLELIRRITKLY